MKCFKLMILFILTTISICYAITCEQAKIVLDIEYDGNCCDLQQINCDETNENILSIESLQVEDSYVEEDYDDENKNLYPRRGHGHGHSHSHSYSHRSSTDRSFDIGNNKFGKPRSIIKRKKSSDVKAVPVVHSHPVHYTSGKTECSCSENEDGNYECSDDEPEVCFQNDDSSLIKYILLHGLLPLAIMLVAFIIFGIIFICICL